MTFMMNKFRRLFNLKHFLTVTLPISCVLLVAVLLLVLSTSSLKPGVDHFLQTATLHRKFKASRQLWGISNNKITQDFHQNEDEDEDEVVVKKVTTKTIPSSSSNGKHDPSSKIQFCNPVPFRRKFSFPEENIICKPHVASKTACKLAEELYRPNEEYETCAKSRQVHICKHYETSSKLLTTVQFDYKCSISECHKYNHNNVLVWHFSKDSGKLEKQSLYTDKRSLEKAVSKLAKASSAAGYNFLFLECASTVEDERPIHDMIAQLLLLPPSAISLEKEESKKPNNIEENKQKINVNIVLLDSAARSHFYRSLPATLSTFNEINQNKESAAEILDFESFQSVEGHTAENLHALFTGSLFPKHFTGNEREMSPAGVAEFFGRFTSNRYKTFYQDDLCYEEYWGVRLELGSPTSFYEFDKVFKDNHIVHSGLTFSSCQLLSINNVTSPFNGPNGPICFNGRTADAYYLDFIHLYHEFASRRKQRLLSYTALNVAHDHTGQRIQSIDYELAEFAKKMSKSQNTLTLLLADHGNTYTHYTHAIMEGRFEQYHPAFFMIVPDGVKEILGDQIMQNLRSNQRKLFTMLDIHHALKHIPDDYPKDTGIFGRISANRTCNDLDLRLPNLCVCEGWDAAALNDTAQVAVLDFAVGQLNNKIQEYQKTARESKQAPNCKKLVPLYFLNVRERNEGGYLVTSLDFVTSAGQGATQQHDVFHVQIQSEVKSDEESRNMKLLNYDRISKYGPYRACADKDIDMRLCVCDMGHSAKQDTSMEEILLRELMDHPKHTKYDLTITKETKTSACIFLRILSYPETTASDSIFSASYEVINICSYELNIMLYVKLDNMKSTSHQPLEKTLAPYSTTYLGSVARSVPYWDSKVEASKLVVESSATDDPYSL